MLARNFMTAEALDIKEKEYNALVSVLGRLERGEIGHKNFDMACPMRSLWTTTTDFDGGVLFTSRTEECGTAGCIGGYVAVEMGVAPARYVYESDKRSGLGRLYFPRDEGAGRLVDCIHSIAPEEGAHALRNFLTTGEPCWDEVLDGRQ